MITKILPIVLLISVLYIGSIYSSRNLSKKLENKSRIFHDPVIDNYLKTFQSILDLRNLQVFVLNENQIINLSRLAKQNNLDVLIEVHTLEELKKSLNENIDLIGVNNRNLKTFKVDLENSINICNQIPENFTKISESGLNSINDLRILIECGFDGFLIGEQFMREKDPGSKLKELINSY